MSHTSSVNQQDVKRISRRAEAMGGDVQRDVVALSDDGPRHRVPSGKTTTAPGTVQTAFLEAFSPTPRP